MKNFKFLLLSSISILAFYGSFAALSENEDNRLSTIDLKTAPILNPQQSSEQIILQGYVKDKSYEKSLSKQNILILDLKTVLEIALNKNLKIETQEYIVKQAQDQKLESAAQFLPSISLVQNLRQRDGHAQIFGNQVIPFRQTSINPLVLGTYNIFQGGRVLFGYVASNNLLKAEKARLDEAQQRTLADTAGAYFSLQRYSSQLESELVRLEQSEENLKNRKIALELGDDIKLSVLLAEQEVEESKARIVSLKQRFYAQSSIFNQLLNLPISDLVVPVGAIEDTEIITWKEKPELIGLVALALKNRPDLHIQEYLVKAQKARQYQSASAFLPTVQLIGSLGLLGPKFTSLYGDQQSSVIVQYDALQNLGGTAVANYLESKHARQALEMQLKDLIKTVESDLANLYLGVLSGQETLIASRSALNVAQESYRQALIRLREGVGTQFEVTVAQTGLERARANYFQTAADCKIAQANLLKGLGMADQKNLVEGVEL